MVTLIFIFILSILIIVHEFGHFFIARRLGVKIERFSLGFGPVIFKLKHKETEYCLSLIPVGGYVKMAGENPEEVLTGNKWEYRSQPIINRFFIISAGPFLNYLLGFFVFWLVFVIGYPSMSTKVGELIKDYPAEKADIRKGDIILKIDDKSVRTWEELTETIRNTKKEFLEIWLKRNDKIMVFTVSPKREILTDFLGRKREISLIGIRPAEEFVQIKYPFLEAGFLAGKRLASLTYLTFLAISQIITGRFSFKDSVSGPLGIFFVTKWAVDLGLSVLLHLLAVLSISLALFNLFPLPVLDGGHIFLLLIEKIRGKALSIKTQERFARIGMAILVLLMLFVFYNDLVRFQVWEKISNFWRK